MNKVVLLLSFTFLINVFSFSQEMRVTGVVNDSTGVRPVVNAVAMAIRLSDSLLLGFTHTDSKGEFILTGFQPDTFSLIIDHPSFDEKTYYIFGNESNNEINIPSVKMLSKSQEIEEVVIYANKNPIFYRGDTLVYVADSFKVHEGAVVEDLIKKLPGLEIDKDGKITSQGQAIDKVLVDGDEFFGSDPTIATKNLGADGVETVQVYEKENDDGIGGDGEKIKVLDLKLKDDAKKGYFGRISGATDFALTPIDGEIGTNPFFEGELLLNKFDNDQKISVFALGANTPTSNFSRGDMSKFGLENEEGAGRNFWEDGTQNNSGIPQTLRAGIYFSDKFGKNKNIKLNTNYSYYNTQLEATSASSSEYYLRDTTYFTNDSLRNFNKNESHRFNIRFIAPLDSLTTLEIKPSFRYDVGSTEDFKLNDFINQTGIQSLQTAIQNDNNSSGVQVDAMAKINRKFRKKKRELELRYDLKYTNNETDGNLNSRSSYISIGSDTIIDQQKTNDNNLTSHFATGTYIEPISKKWRIELQYMFEYGQSNQTKETFDGVNGVYNSYRADLSNVFDNTRQQHRGGLRFLYTSKKHTLKVGARLRNIDIQNINRVTNVTVHQNITNLLPRLNYQFKPTLSKRFTLAYNTSSSQPSINDLAPVPDNTDPNRIQEGNPDLRPNYNHAINLMFNTWQAMTGRYIWSGFFANLTDDAFASSVSYDQYGRTISKTVNVDGNINLTVFAGGGYPMFKRKMTLRPSLNGSFNRYSNFISGEKNITDNLSLGGSFDIDFDFDSLEFNIGVSANHTNPKSSLSTVSNVPFYTSDFYGGFTWRLPHGFTIGSDANYTLNRQQGSGLYDIDFFVWNAEVSKSFLKTNNLVVALIAKDILNQNVNATRQVNGNVITNYRTTIISRYFLLKVTLRFNNRKTKEEDFNGWH